MEKEETNKVNTQTSERTEGADTVPLFQILFLEVWGEEYVEGQWRVEQDSACCRWKNAIHYHTSDQEVQEKIFQEERKGSV